MVPSIGGLRFVDWGLISMLLTCYWMSYRISTPMGISKDSHSHSNMQNWVLGPLQGSGAPPALWLSIICIILGDISKRARGIKFFANSQNTLHLQRAPETYVDDTEL